MARIVCHVRAGRRSAVADYRRDFLFQGGGCFWMIGDDVFCFAGVGGEVIQFRLCFSVGHDQLPFSISDRETSFGRMSD